MKITRCFSCMTENLLRHNWLSRKVTVRGFTKLIQKVCFFSKRLTFDLWSILQYEKLFVTTVFITKYLHPLVALASPNYFLNQKKLGLLLRFACHVIIFYANSFRFYCFFVWVFLKSVCFPCSESKVSYFGFLM